MPKLIFTAEELSRYFNGQYKHKAYNETVQMAADMFIHANGIFPKKMMEERRPSESKAVLEYRQKIWKPITKPIFSKVITELNKIRRSSDWSIKYDDSKKPPTRIIPEESLKEYCEVRYPFFGSVTNWVFKVLLPGYCKDANAVIAIMPTNPQAPANEFVRPFGHLYYSDCVIDFVQNDFAVIKSTDKVVYKVGEAKSFGDVYYIFTTRYVQRWEQSNGTMNFNLAWEYIHNIGELPVFRVEGLYKKNLDDTFIFESRLSSMLPRLDEALREYSDLQAEVVQHVFSEKWEMASDDCDVCKGNGKITTPGFAGQTTVCKACEGSGAKSRGPFSKIMIKPTMAGEPLPPLPPAGYVQKNGDIVAIQDKRIKEHVHEALSAINMEYLSQTPLNESGTSKEVDKDSLNNFVHSIAEDIVAVQDKIYYFTSEYRYGFVLPNKDDRKSLLPYVNVPEKFDLLSSTYLESQISKQKEGKGNPIIIAAMEEDYVNKKFVGDNILRQRVLLSIKLDPLSGISDDDKMVRLSNKGITLENYIISCNISDFINRALEEKGDKFFQMSLKDQKALLLQYAKEQTAGSSVEGSILSEFETETGAGGNTLKNSVGGLTGMIEIAKAVASGLYDLEAAVALVSDRFGISEDEARKQLGTPQLSNSEEAIDKVAKLT